MSFSQYELSYSHQENQTPSMPKYVLWDWGNRHLTLLGWETPNSQLQPCLGYKDDLSPKPTNPKDSQLNVGPPVPPGALVEVGLTSLSTQAVVQ